MKRNYYVVFLFLLVFMVPFVSAQGGDFVSGDAISFNHEIDTIDIITTYQRSDDFSAGWRITGNKAVDIKLEVDSNPGGYVVLVEHLHVDIFIESRWERYDDITQDSMDDYFHGLQGGFLVDLSHPYFETFSIEGSSPEFQQSIGYAWSTSLSSDTSRTYKFSEEFLTENCGVFGNSLYFVYDVIYGTSIDGPFYKGIVTDNILIDINGTVYDNSGNEMDEYYEDTDSIPGYIGLSVVFGGLIICLIIIGKKSCDV